MCCVGWEDFIGKHVKIIQTDGFAKFGTLTKVNDDFIELIFDNGKPHIIFKNSIASVALEEGW